MTRQKVSAIPMLVIAYLRQGHGLKCQSRSLKVSNLHVWYLGEHGAWQIVTNWSPSNTE